MEREAKRNAKRDAERDRLLQQAFTAEDPAPLLLDILKKDPAYPALLPYLVGYYFDAVRNDPYRAQSLASALVRLVNSTDAPSFGGNTLKEHLYSELAGSHFKLFDVKKKFDVVYGPNNTHLIDSLLSGFSFKFNLATSSHMFGVIGEGLDDPDDSKMEIMVVGACIQLLIHGSGIYKEAEGKPGELSKKLKAHKMAEVVKDPLALKVLEVHFKKRHLC